jgi:hypothetical protein
MRSTIQAVALWQAWHGRERANAGRGERAGPEAPRQEARRGSVDGRHEAPGRRQLRQRALGIGLLALGLAAGLLPFALLPEH